MGAGLEDEGKVTKGLVAASGYILIRSSQVNITPITSDLGNKRFCQKLSFI